MSDPVSEVIRLLQERRAALCTVESCTGGGIAARVTSVPGASSVFWGSLVTYDNSAKTLLAGVPASLLSAHGAVSAEVALSLADGGLARLKEGLRDSVAGIRSPSLLICVAITGVAGPGGGSNAKPVGLCHIAITASDGSRHTAEFRAASELPRERIRELFALEALSCLRAKLESVEGAGLPS